MLTVTRTTLLTYNLPSVSSQGYPVPLPAATSRALTRRQVVAPVQQGQRALLAFLPRPVKLALLAVLLANYRSLPGFWHLRVFRPIIALRLRALAFFTYVRLCLLAARAARALRLPGVPPTPSGPGILALGLPGARQQFMHSVAARALAARGGPLDKAVKQDWTGWASLDDCDWNWHLSNSAYNKNFDYARTDFLFAYLAPFFADGGLVALGHSEFHFVAEIGIGQSYRIETRIASWDGKWLYLVGRFLSRKTPAQRRKEKGKARAIPGSETSSSSTTPRHVPFAVWPPPSQPVTAGHSKDSTFSAHVKEKDAKDGTKPKEVPTVDLAASFTTAADYTDADANTDLTSEADADIKSEVDSILSPDEAAARSSSTAPASPRASGGNGHGRDGSGNGEGANGNGEDEAKEWTLHAVGVTSYCFKHRASRRSVPPALVLAAVGFGDGEGDSPSPWDRLQRMRHGGAAGDVRRFWAGGWAAGDAFWEPVAQRWEEGRVRGLREMRRA